MVYRPTIWCWPTPFPATGGPEIHDGGMPFDWCISSDRADEPYVPRLREEQRRYGGGWVVYGMTAAVDPATRDETIDRLRATRAELRQAGLDVGRVANLWHGSRLSTPKVEAARAAGFEVIDGYVPRASTCGLGAPYYPFYIGPVVFQAAPWRVSWNPVRRTWPSRTKVTVRSARQNWSPDRRSSRSSPPGVTAWSSPGQASSAKLNGLTLAADTTHESLASGIRPGYLGAPAERLSMLTLQNTLNNNLNADADRRRAGRSVF